MARRSSHSQIDGKLWQNNPSFGHSPKWKVHSSSFACAEMGYTPTHDVAISRRHLLFVQRCPQIPTVPIN